jgi:hypothetical protein
MEQRQESRTIVVQNHVAVKSIDFLQVSNNVVDFVSSTSGLRE